jgi:hypothetical protein
MMYTGRRCTVLTVIIYTTKGKPCSLIENGKKRLGEAFYFKEIVIILPTAVG